MKAERRTTQLGTARKPAAPNSAAPQPSNFEGTLSHQDEPPGPPAMVVMSLRRKDRSTAFFSHWCTTHSPVSFEATRSVPESSRFRAVSTASRTSPFVAALISARFSKAVSRTDWSWA